MRQVLFFFFTILSFCANCQKYYLFIGSYTDSGSKGIYVYTFDASTGNAAFVSNTNGIVNPSFLTISPGGNFIYACTETRTANAGSISSFSFNKKNGSLQFINKQSSGGDNPVYVSAHRDGRWVVCGNYTGGSVAALAVNKDGSLSPAAQVIKHTGGSVDSVRQDRSHVHSTIFSPDYRHLYVPDLGLDKVMIYRFSEQAAIPLTSTSQQFIRTVPGSGPRHFAFHPNGKYGYLAEEMGGFVDVYKRAGDTLQQIQRIPAHRAETRGPFGSADIHTSPDGRFLYVTNRAKENNIAIFSIGKTTGKLTPVGYESTRGEGPRNFIIEPSGKFLLVANQLSGNIVIFKRNIKTGLLQATGKEIAVPEVSCLQMLKR
ncbi:MAG: lactonase family protein [Segetibacter sp.]